jgi:hypothetical protein
MMLIRTVSARGPTRKASSDIMYSPSSSNRPEPLPLEGVATASLKRVKRDASSCSPRLTQSARARLGGAGIVVPPLLSFADSQDALTDALSSAALTRSVAVAPLPRSARTALNVRSVAPTARPVQPLQPRGAVRSGRAGVGQLALYSSTSSHRGVVLGRFGV